MQFPVDKFRKTDYTHKLCNLNTKNKQNKMNGSIFSMISMSDKNTQFKTKTDIFLRLNETSGVKKE